MLNFQGENFEGVFIIANLANFYKDSKTEQEGAKSTESFLKWTEWNWLKNGDLLSNRLL